MISKSHQLLTSTPCAMTIGSDGQVTFDEPA